MATGCLWAGEGELGHSGRRLSKSGKIADNDWPIRLGVCADLADAAVVQNRYGIARKDHRERQSDRQPETATLSVWTIAGFDIFAHSIYSLCCGLAGLIAGIVPIRVFVAFLPFLKICAGELLVIIATLW